MCVCVITVILIPIRVGSESMPSQGLHLGISPHWPPSQEKKPLSKAVVYKKKKKRVCARALGDVQGNALGVKKEKFRISIYVSLNIKIKAKSSFSNI